MHVCVVVDNPLTYDVRVLRQVRLLRREGHEVTVVALEDPEGRALPDLAGASFVGVPSFGGLRVAGRIQGAGATGSGAPRASLAVHLRRAVARSVSRLSRFVGYHRYVRRSMYLGRHVIPRRPDLCHANNLGSLPAALACKLLFGTKVVYDAHELEGQRAGWSKVARWRARLVERACIRHVDRVVTVSDSIAAYLSAKYRIPPPTVIRNVAETPPVEDVEGRRQPDGHGLRTLIYVGGIAPGRGLEQLVDAMSSVPEVRAVIIGPDMGSAHALARRAEELGVSDRIDIRAPVPPDTLGTVLQDADAGYSGIENVSLSYYYSLPNKVFQYLSYGLPVVASDLPEVRRLLAGGGAGVLFDPQSREALVEAIRAVFRGDRQHARARALALADQNSWEREEQRLLRLYEDLAAVPRTWRRRLIA